MQDISWYCSDGSTVMGRFHWAVRFGTVRYAIISVSIVRSCEWYQNSKPYHTTFCYPSVGVPSTAKGTKRVELNSLQNVDWLKGIKLLLHSFRSAVRVGLIYIRVRKHKKNITVYFMILYFHTDNSRFSIYILVCSCGLVKRHCPKTHATFKVLLLSCHEM